MPGIELAAARENLRQRGLGKPRLKSDGCPCHAARLDEVTQCLEAGHGLNRVTLVLVPLDEVGENIKVILLIRRQKIAS